jgi:hypothetical protein
VLSERAPARFRAVLDTALMRAASAAMAHYAVKANSHAATRPWPHSGAVFDRPAEMVSIDALHRRRDWLRVARSGSRPAVG